MYVLQSTQNHVRVTSYVSEPLQFCLSVQYYDLQYKILGLYIHQKPFQRLRDVARRTEFVFRSLEVFLQIRRLRGAHGGSATPA